MVFVSTCRMCTDTSPLQALPRAPDARLLGRERSTGVGMHRTRVAPTKPLPLAAINAAPATARRYVREALTRLGRPALIDAAELGASELATNDCLQAQTP